MAARVGISNLPNTGAKAVEAAQFTELKHETFMELRSLGFPIAMEDLEKPRTDKLMDIFERMIFLVTDSSMRDAATTLSTFSNVFEYAPLHERSVLMLTMTLSLDEILYNTQYPEGFYIRDLISPTCKKTVNVLNHLVKFFRSKQERTPFVEEVMESVEASLNEAARLKKENDALRERIANARLRLNDAQPHIKRTRERKEELAKEFERLKTKADESTARRVKLDEKVQSAEMAHKKKADEVDRMRKEDQRLESQMVTSPDRFVNEVKTYEKGRIELTDEIKQINEALEVNEKREKMFHSSSSLLNSCLTPLEEILKEQKRLETLDEESRTIQQEMEVLHQAVAGQINKNNGRRKALVGRESSLKSMVDDYEKKMADVSMQLERTKLSLQATEDERRRNGAVSSDLDKKCDEIQQQLATLDRNMLIRKRQIFSQVQEIQRKVEEDTKSSKNKLRSLEKEMKKDFKK